MADPRTSFEQELPQKLASGAIQPGVIGGLIVFHITGAGGGTWSVDCRDGKGSVCPGELGEADCKFELTSGDWRLLTEDSTRLMPLYFANRIKVTGNSMYGTKIKMLIA